MSSDAVNVVVAPAASPAAIVCVPIVMSSAFPMMLSTESTYRTAKEAAAVVDVFWIVVGTEGVVPVAKLPPEKEIVATMFGLPTGSLLIVTNGRGLIQVLLALSRSATVLFGSATRITKNCPVGALLGTSINPAVKRLPDAKLVRPPRSANASCVSTKSSALPSTSSLDRTTRTNCVIPVAVPAPRFATVSEEESCPPRVAVTAVVGPKTTRSADVGSVPVRAGTTTALIALTTVLFASLVSAMSLGASTCTTRR